MLQKAEQIGLVQIYTGNGKGKSTAAFGLALRACGNDFKTVIIQFMKQGKDYCEIKALSYLPNLQVYSYGTEKFVKKGQPDQENLALAAQALAKAQEIIAQNDADLLILDELNNALYFDLITLNQALSLISIKPPQMEIVLTGRNAPQQLIDIADLVTEMKEIKHPYQQGIQARKGIEY